MLCGCVSQYNFPKKTPTNKQKPPHQTGTWDTPSLPIWRKNPKTRKPNSESEAFIFGDMFYTSLFRFLNNDRKENAFLISAINLFFSIQWLTAKYWIELWGNQGLYQYELFFLSHHEDVRLLNKFKVWNLQWLRLIWITVLLATM